LIWQFSEQREPGMTIK